MTTSPAGQLVGHLWQLIAPAGAINDADLLARFASRRDEPAFEAILQRHGPLVFGVCRRVLRNDAEAEDAFQATFLVLAHKAASLTNSGALSSWLYGVAYRTALKARALLRKRQVKESQVPPRQPSAPESELGGELEQALDEELHRLPEKYRRLVVLCDLQGLSRRDAAARLGVSEGTLSGQLFRARRRLADRLRKRGLGAGLGAGALAALLARTAQAAPPAAAVQGAARAAGAFAAGLPVPGGVVSPAVLTLTSGVLKAMFARKLLTGLLALVLIAAIGLGWASYSTLAAQQPPKGADDKKAEPDAKADAAEPPNVLLLQHRKIVRELKCSDEQWDKIDDALEKAGKEMMEELQKQVAGAAGGAAPDDKAMKAALARAGKEIVTKVLRPAQVKRLHEIDLQASGAYAFKAPCVEKALKLTDKQKGRVKELIEGMEKEVKDRVKAMLANPAGAITLDLEQLQPNHAPVVKAIQAELTADQKKAWKGLVGQPVKFDLKKATRGQNMIFPPIGGVIGGAGGVALPAAGGGVAGNGGN